MKARNLNLIWLGIGLAVFYWLAESLLHTFLFDGGPLAVTLLGEGDPNEVWMRALISVLFVAFGWIADRSVRAERHLLEDAQRLNRLLRFLDRLMLSVRHPTELPLAPEDTDRLPQARAAFPSASGANGERRSDDAHRIEDLAFGKDDIGRLARFLQELSGYLDVRFRELYGLLHLTQEINKPLLLDDVLEKAYEMLQSILPYDRLSVALILDGGQVVRARWARSNYPEMMLRRGFTRPLKGSSLQGIISSGEPRILNDLAAYLETHPHSDSTRLMVTEGIRSSLTCPLIAMGRPIGFMFFSSRAPHAYQDPHIEIFKLIAAQLSVVVEKSNLYQQILREKENSERLLLNVMPARIAARLSSGKQPVAENLPDISILFLDIEDFTGFASRFPPERVLDLLENIFVPLDRLCDLHGVEKIKTIGDEYMAISGPSGSPADGSPQNLAEFALEALKLVEGMRYPDGRMVSVRIGMHAGPAVAGVVGQKKFAYDIWGDAVNVASRMESSGEAGRIHVTQEIQSRLQNEFVFEERGTIEIKGRGPMKTYFLIDRR